jgi:indole-3-glycerol phosphate synthase
MTILDQIIEKKLEEVAERKSYWPIDLLQSINLYNRPTLSLSAAIVDPTKTAIIAEYKRQSPSKGIINANAAVETVVEGYTQHGASGVSVLTDTPFFGGSTEDMISARKYNIPLLRKEFIIDAYQVHEARAMGADAILLIAACLTPQQVQDLAGLARELGLEVLLELHDASELAHVHSSVQLVGVNNRNLKNFEVNLQHSIDLCKLIPNNYLKIAESGIDGTETIRTLKQEGFNGFLIGERFMKHADPTIAFAQFVHQM